MWMPEMDDDREERRDLEYWMQLYPAQTRQIQREVERQCDMLDYNGSVIYDEFPDRVALARICEAIYQALMQGEMMQGTMPGSMTGGMSGNMPGRMPGNMPERMSSDMTGDMSDQDDDTMDIDTMDTASDIAPEEESDGAYDYWNGGGMESYQVRGRDRSVQDLIEVLLFNEIHRRRRRRRNRRSWYMGR